MATGVDCAPAPRPVPLTRLRLAVYTDSVYWHASDGLRCAETFSVFAGRLRSSTARLVLVGRTVEPRDGGHLLPDGVELLELPSYPSLADPRATGAVLRSVRVFWRGLDDVDAVWLLGPHPLSLVFSLAAMLRRRHVVLGVRQDLPAHMRSRHAESRWIPAAADALDQLWRLLARRCPTAVVGQDLALRYRRSRDLLTLVVSLVEDADLTDVQERDAAAGRPLTLLSVGRLDPEKNPLLLVEVLRLLRQQDDRWRLVVCGDGTMAGELAEDVRTGGLVDAVRLAGELPLDRLWAEYRAADVLLHASWTEGVPQVLFEAFAAGVPVVATDVGGVAATARDAAMLVPAGDAGAAAHAVAAVAGDEVLRRRLVQRGLEVARRTTGTCQRRALLAVLTPDGRETA